MGKYNYYAIKVGNNAKDIITETWEECSNFVIGYPSVYKGFKTMKEAKEYLRTMTDEMIEERLLWGQVQRFNRLKNKLQVEYGFAIPDYIIDEIINNDDYDNLCALLNLAVLNNRISKKNARIIQEREKNRKK